MPTRIIDPNTGLPFPGNLIPADRITRQASTLLGYYPEPNIAGVDGANFQAPVLTSTHQDSVQSRVTQNLTNRTQLFGSIGYQRTNTDTTSLFGFDDETISSGTTGIVNYAHRFSPFWQVRLRYQFDRAATDTTPFFANRTNVAGVAGIGGTDQDPLFWGPPRLLFSQGILSLADGLPNLTHTRTHTAAAESLWNHGRHNVTFGAGVHHTGVDLSGQQDPRGTFSFTGGTTGLDFADFLLGRAQTSGIAFGIANKALTGMSGEAYMSDDWRVSPVLTLSLGVRWEYEGPLTEQSGNLVNLTAAPGFTSVAQAIGGSPLRPDWRGVEPRVAMAWRPIAGSSLLLRAGYGIYRNTNVYQSVETLLAQQPPLSKTFNVQTTPAAPLTLETGLVNPPVPAAPNTFAVDPDLRVGFAHNWQASMQRDLPGSMTVIATYLGSKGSHLFQEFLPNTYAPGALNPCPSCPSGFVYLTSNGRSIRNAAQLEVRRRLRNGLTATLQYTLAKAMDDAGAFNNVSLAGSGIAQDWQNLGAEWAPSNFDQRHLLTLQAQYTTGVGVTGGALLTGRTGALVKNWTVQTQMTVGSGMPVTPILLAPIPGSAVTGALRASLTGAPTEPASGLYANSAAYSAPAAGQFGDAGRNSITGPAQFSMSAGVTRSFPLGERLNLDWRIDATNVLNQVTYSGIGTTLGSSQFGAPIAANSMRKVLTTVRLRF